MKKIVLSTDLSRIDDYAMQRAIMLAVRFKAKLYLLHIGPDESRQSVENHFNRLFGHEECDASIHVIKGDPSQEILKFSDKVDADLIVLGPHKGPAEAYREMFSGETVKNVIRNTVKPVLMVRKPPLDDYNKILVSVDFSAPSRRAFYEAARLVPDAEFYLLHTFDVPFSGLIKDEYSEEEFRREHNENFQELLDTVQQELAQGGTRNLKVVKLLSRGMASEEIQETAEKFSVELLAMGTKGKSKLKRMLIGSVAENLLSHPPCDILITPGYPDKPNDRAIDDIRSRSSDRND